MGPPADSRKPSPDDPLVVASAALERQKVTPFTTLIVPKRGRNDLILPEPLKTHVLEIAAFHKVWPAVCGPWGFGRMMTGPGGIKALFTGDSGTGKTLAAEVIAKELGRPLLKLDLSRIVSKWVGETEKHLDAVFLEAEDRESVLCLDEADSLLGKRGEIRQGTDRYANLEVSYLLQRLEEHPGLVVMASNHKENIDPAFMRRFQTILHFPRPGLVKRPDLAARVPRNGPVSNGGKSQVRRTGEARHDRRRHRRIGADRGAAGRQVDETRGTGDGRAQANRRCGQASVPARVTGSFGQGAEAARGRSVNTTKAPTSPTRSKLPPSQAPQYSSLAPGGRPTPLSPNLMALHAAYGNGAVARALSIPPRKPGLPPQSLEEPQVASEPSLQGTTPSQGTPPLQAATSPTKTPEGGPKPEVAPEAETGQSVRKCCQVESRGTTEATRAAPGQAHRASRRGGRRRERGLHQRWPPETRLRSPECRTVSRRCRGGHVREARRAGRCGRKTTSTGHSC